MKTSLLATALILGLAACNSPTPSQTAAATDPAVEAESTGADASSAPAADADLVGAADDATGINTPLPADAIDLRLALSGVPKYDAARDLLLFDVQVTNAGSTMVVSKGSKPVRLGLVLAGPEGVDKAPGKLNFKRVALPKVVPDAQVTVHAQAPVKPLLGLQLKVDVVQEGVAWFGRKYGKPVLDVGSFERCAQGGQTLCDSSGTPVSAL